MISYFVKITPIFTDSARGSQTFKQHCIYWHVFHLHFECPEFLKQQFDLESSYYAALLEYLILRSGHTMNLLVSATAVVVIVCSENDLGLFSML